jgi:hypothetical protein
MYSKAGVINVLADKIFLKGVAMVTIPDLGAALVCGLACCLWQLAKLTPWIGQIGSRTESCDVRRISFVKICQTVNVRQYGDSLARFVALENESIHFRGKLAEIKELTKIFDLVRVTHCGTPWSGTVY